MEQEFGMLVKKNQDFSEYGSLFDTISVCLSKGLVARSDHFYLF